MQLPGQDGSNRAAQVTDEAVEENAGCSGLFCPIFASLVHEPLTQDLASELWQIVQGANNEAQITHRKDDRSRSRTERALRPTGTQSLPASREKQAVNESTQKSSKR